MGKYDSLENIEEDDVHVYAEDSNDKNNHVYVESNYMRLREEHIKDTVLEELNKYKIKGVNVYVYDNGAYDCTLLNRLHDELKNQAYIFD